MKVSGEVSEANWPVNDISGVAIERLEAFCLLLFVKYNFADISEAVSKCLSKPCERNVSFASTIQLVELIYYDLKAHSSAIYRSELVLLD